MTNKEVMIHDDQLMDFSNWSNLFRGFPKMVSSPDSFAISDGTISGGRLLGGGLSVHMEGTQTVPLEAGYLYIEITASTSQKPIVSDILFSETMPTNSEDDFDYLQKHIDAGESPEDVNITNTYKVVLYRINSAGNPVEDLRSTDAVVENKLTITSGGGIQSTVNGKRSNVINIDDLENKKDFSFIVDTLHDMAVAIGVDDDILTYQNLVDILDYNNADSLTLTFSQSAGDTAHVLNPPITNGELVIQRQYGNSGNLFIRYIESGAVGATPYGNFIQKINRNNDIEKKFDWYEFSRESAGLFDVTEMLANDTLNLPVERDRIYSLELTSLLGTVQDLDIFMIKNFYDETQNEFNYFNGFFKNNFGETRKIAQEDVFDLILNIVGFESLNISIQVETFNGKVRASGQFYGLSPKNLNKEITGEFSFETKTVVETFELTALTPMTARLITSEKGSY